MSVRWFPVAGEQDAVTERRASTDQVIPVAGGGPRGQGAVNCFWCWGLAWGLAPARPRHPASVGFLARFLFLSLGGVFLRKQLGEEWK